MICRQRWRQEIMQLLATPQITWAWFQHTHTQFPMLHLNGRSIHCQVIQKTWVPQVFQLKIAPSSSNPSIPRRKPATSCESVRRAALKPSRCTCVCARSARPSLRTGMRWRSSGMPSRPGIKVWPRNGRDESRGNGHINGIQYLISIDI